MEELDACAEENEEEVSLESLEDNCYAEFHTKASAPRDESKNILDFIGRYHSGECFGCDMSLRLYRKDNGKIYELITEVEQVIS